MIQYSIPDSYVELEYIYSNTGYIETNYIPKSYDKLYITFHLTDDYIITEEAPHNSGGICGAERCFKLYYVSNNGLLNESMIGKDVTFIKYGSNCDFSLVIGGYRGYGQSYGGSNPDRYHGVVMPFTHTDNHYIQYKVIKVFNSNDILIHHYLPVRRLGDGICGLFDTVEQKFFSSSVDIQYKGGNIQTIKNEHNQLLNSDNEHKSTITMMKTNLMNRIDKSFICDAINQHGIGHYGLIQDDDTIFSLQGDVKPYIHRWYGVEVYGYIKKREITRILPERKKESPTQILQNVNPNWNIVKSESLTTSNTFETNNEILFIENKIGILDNPSFNVYNIGTTTPATDDGYYLGGRGV